MKEQKEMKLLLYFTIAYLILFTVLSLIKGNLEFLYYTVIVAALIFIIAYYHKKIHLPKTILIGLSILGALHMLGGTLTIATTRLYDFWFIPGIFKYDNLVHSLGIFLVTFVVYNLLRPHLSRRLNHQPFLLSLLLVTIAMGVGALNEVLELGAVVFLDAAKGVGDYMNNALDLVFNLAGSILASLIIIHYHKKHPRKKR